MSEKITLTKKLCLYPNKEQEEQFRKFCGTARFCYNECLRYKQEMYKEHKKNVTIQGCIEHIQKLKTQEEYGWIKEAPEAVTKQAIKDLDKAYKSFFKRGGFPKYKKKGKCKESFYQRTDSLRFIDDKHVKITGIKQPVKVQKCEYRGKFLNPRVSYDGKHWYLTFAYEYEVEQSENKGIIGVDLGIKNLAVVSDGRVFENINKGTVLKKLEGRKKRLQRKLSKKYEKNRRGNRYVKTKNIKKLQCLIGLIDRRMENIRNTYIHEVTKSLVRTKPERIVIEDLNVNGMLKNRYLSKAISACEFGKFRTYLEYKSKLNGVELLVADRYYPSSKRCSRCGSVKSDLKLSERVYVCENCGLEMDRDKNASINLSRYAPV